MELLTICEMIFCHFCTKYDIQKNYRNKCQSTLQNIKDAVPSRSKHSSKMNSYLKTNRHPYLIRMQPLPLIHGKFIHMENNCVKYLIYYQ